MKKIVFLLHFCSVSLTYAPYVVHCMACKNSNKLNQKEFVLPQIYQQNGFFFNDSTEANPLNMIKETIKKTRRRSRSFSDIFTSKTDSSCPIETTWAYLRDDPKQLQNLFCANAQKKFLKRSTLPRITSLGGPTILIQVGYTNILIDPYFEEHSSSSPRLFPPSIPLDFLIPFIDIILISNNYHLEKLTFKKLASSCKTQRTNLARPMKQPHILVPKGLKYFFVTNGFDENNVDEFMWWEQKSFTMKHAYKKRVSTTVTRHIIKNEITCTFLPAKSKSRSNGLKYKKSAWGSWMVEYNIIKQEAKKGRSLIQKNRRNSICGTRASKMMRKKKTQRKKSTKFRLYFSGDCGYSNYFEIIASKFPTIDVAIISIATQNKYSLEHYYHMRYIEASKAFRELKAKLFIPAFSLDDKNYVEDFKITRDHSFKNHSIRPLIIGKPTVITNY